MGAICTIQGARSWRIANDVVDAAVTVNGGHLGPVKFRTANGLIEPFSVAPWHRREVANGPKVLKHLRGDFFCAPFGGNSELWENECHPVHGESASERWRLRDHSTRQGVTEFRAEMVGKIRSGLITKLIRLRKGQPVIYCRDD